MDDGQAVIGLTEEIARECADEPALFALAGDCAAVARWMREEASLDDRLSGSVPFCTMLSVAVAGWQLLRQLRAVEQGAAPALTATKKSTVRFFLDRTPEAAGLKAAATAGSIGLYELETAHSWLRAVPRDLLGGYAPRSRLRRRSLPARADCAGGLGDCP